MEGFYLSVNASLVQLITTFELRDIFIELNDYNFGSDLGRDSNIFLTYCKFFAIISYLYCMPGRRDIFHTQGIYHIFNRTIDKKPIFLDTKLAQVFLDTLYFYRSQKAYISFSQFRHLSPDIAVDTENNIANKQYFKINILAYCLMPTHFHLLVEELHEDGIVSVMSNSVNSLTRFYNIKKKRKGPLFLPRFQSREVVTDELLAHVSRYQHLNPFSSDLIKKMNDLIYYPWSSYRYYVTKDVSPLVKTNTILDIFGNDSEKYRSFVHHRANYQRSLEELKYIEKWNT